MKFSRRRPLAERRPRNTGEVVTQPQEDGLSSELFELQKDFTEQDWEDAEESVQTTPTIDLTSDPSEYWRNVGDWKDYAANARIVALLAHEAHRTVHFPEHLFENLLSMIDEINKQEIFTEVVHAYEKLLIVVSSALAIFPERREELLQHPVVKAMAPLYRTHSNRAIVESTCVFPERKKVYEDEYSRSMGISNFKSIIITEMTRQSKGRVFVAIQAAADLAVLFPELPKAEYLDPDFFSYALAQFRMRQKGNTGPSYLPTASGIKARRRAALNLLILSAERAEIGDDGQIHITPRPSTLRKPTPLPPRPPHV